MPRTKSNARPDSRPAKKNAVKRKATMTKAGNRGVGKSMFTLGQHASQGKVAQDRRSVAAEGASKEVIRLKAQIKKLKASAKKGK
jgi:hypothetical protein